MTTTDRQHAICEPHHAPRFLVRYPENRPAVVYPLCSDCRAPADRRRHGVLVWVYDTERGIYPVQPEDLRVSEPKIKTTSRNTRA